VKVVAHFPMKTVSEMNQRCHWSVRHKRFKAQKEAAWAELKAVRMIPPVVPLVVELTRVSPRRVNLDDDNLVSAMKAIRDGAALYLKVDDGDPRIQWKYSQRPGQGYFVTITITPG